MGHNQLTQLIHKDPDSWSAITVSAWGHEAIIVNLNRRRDRYPSDVMHEQADLHLGHQPSTMFLPADGGMALRGYDRVAEEEANWAVQEIASAMGSVDRC